MKRATTVSAIALLCGLGWSAGAMAQELKAEVIHWWTSEGESHALAAIADEYQARGGEWIDNAVVGGEAARALALNRILGGDPPTVAMWNVSAQFGEVVNQGLLNDIDSVAEADDWRSFLPAVIVDNVSRDGHWYAIPVNIHANNWMFYNMKIFEEVGVEAPTTWDEFFEVADKIKAAGHVAIAFGGQPWQENLVYQQLVIGVGGKDYYRQLYVDHDVTLAGDETMVKVFETFGRMREYVDEGNPNRNWNDATNMVITGRAAMQIMGDWAKGEFRAANMEPGVDYGCALLPGEPVYWIGGDAFTLAKTDDPDQIAAQELMARVMLDPAVQVEFNKRKGSVPVRLDVPTEDLDICAQKGLAVLADPENHVPAANMVYTPDLDGAVQDVVTNFWHDPSMTAEDAAQQVAEAWELANF